MAHEPNLAYCLSYYVLQTKNCYCVFKWWWGAGESKDDEYLGMWKKLCEIQISVSINKVRWACGQAPLAPSPRPRPPSSRGQSGVVAAEMRGLQGLQHLRSGLARRSLLTPALSHPLKLKGIVRCQLHPQDLVEEWGERAVFPFSSPLQRSLDFQLLNLLLPLMSLTQKSVLNPSFWDWFCLFVFLPLGSVPFTSKHNRVGFFGLFFPPGDRFSTDGITINTPRPAPLTGQRTTWLPLSRGFELRHPCRPLWGPGTHFSFSVPPLAITHPAFFPTLYSLAGPFLPPRLLGYLPPLTLWTQSCLCQREMLLLPQPLARILAKYWWLPAESQPNKTELEEMWLVKADEAH